MTTEHPERALDKEIVAYNAMKKELQNSYDGKWVVFHESKFQGAYEDFNSAAADAVKKFGRGPYLIRQVGEEDLVLPASVVYSVYHDAC